VFAVWFLVLPQVTFFSSSIIYENMSVVALPFVAAFVLFSLLARAKKLPKVHIFAALASVITSVVCYAFLFSKGVQTQLLLFCVLMVLAAYLLVAWGGVLRHLAAEDAFALMMKGLVVVGAFRLLVGMPNFFSGGVSNWQVHYLSVMAILAILPLISGLYFMRTIPRQTFYQAFSERGGNGFYFEKEKRGFLPSIVVLLGASVFVTSFVGFVYSPYMFNQVELDLAQGLVELLIAVVALVALGAIRKSTDGGSFNLSFVTFTTAVVYAILFLAVVGLLLTLLGQKGVYASQTVLGALGDTLFLLIIFFVISPTYKNRSGFFSRLLFSVVGSGMLWAYAFGSETKRLIGYDVVTIGVATMIVIAGISILFLLALTSASFSKITFGKGESLIGAPSDVLSGLSAQAGPSRKQTDSADALPEALQSGISRWPSDVVKRACGEALEQYHLSPRELQVANFLLEGLTAADIAQRLQIGPGTVRGYIKSLYRKCAINSKAMLFRLVFGDSQ
jgi:DNA-binding CsgD family transcriptional regulator